jgi:hypothetical protein
MTCKFCETFASMAGNSDFIKGCKTFKKERERKILNFQYQNWLTEEDIDLLPFIFGYHFFFTLSTKI